MSKESSIRDILSRDETFRYQLLSRMKMDCEYFLGNGQRLDKHLWAGNPEEHIYFMKEIWKSFPEDMKPEWLSYEDILGYERKMNDV